MVMEGAALADRREYQDSLAEGRGKGLPAAPVVEQQLRQQVKQSMQREV